MSGRGVTNGAEPLLQSLEAPREKPVPHARRELRLEPETRDGVVLPARGRSGVTGQHGNGGPPTGTAPPETEFLDLVRRELELLGEDPEREGLQRTPARVAAAMGWLTQGYGQDVRDVVGNGVFHDPYENMVLVRDIELFSMCEHHMLPFFGRAHVAYVPDGRIIGLSKIPRIVDVFARRLQVQERLTEQIADALMDVLQPAGLGVVIEAQHLCMMMRGVQKQNSSTATSALRGSIRDDPATRQEFLRLAQRHE